MRSCGTWSLVVLAVLAVLVPAARSDPPPSSERKTPPMPPSAKPPTPDPAKPRLEMLRFPADAIIVLCKEAADALASVPDAVILSAQKYQELRDELARLREQLGPRKPIAPSRCQLTGKVEGGLVLLKAQLDFVTERPDTVVALACGQGVATAADLDGHTPQFRPEGEGFAVVVDKPGEHQVKLDLAVGLTTREGSPAIELALPRAAITTVDVELPKGASDLRLGGRSLSRVLSFKDGKLTGGLGPADRFDLTYKEPRPAAATAVAVADGRIVVHVGPDGVTTDAELTLLCEAGMIGLWQIVVPRGSVLRLAPEDQDRLAGPIESADQPVGTLRTLRLRGPSSAPLKVAVTARGPRPQAGASVPIGPFTVVGAARQGGILLVSNTARELHLDYRIHAGLRRQATPSEEDRQAELNIVAAFRYGETGLEAPLKGPVRSSWYGSWLEVDMETVRGQIKAHVTHLLQLQLDAKGGFLWQITTTIDAAPRWADVDHLKVLLPAGWVNADDPDAGPGAGERTVDRRLLRGPGETTQRVTLVLKGHYSQIHGKEGEARLPLPRPLGVIDEGAKITLAVEDDQELLPPAVSAGIKVTQMNPHEQVWDCSTPPDGITVSWKPYVPDVRAESVADIELKPQGADVWRHEFRLRLPQPPPEQLTLRVPAGIDSLQIEKGGRLLATPDKTRRLVRLENVAGQDRILVLRYFVPGAMLGSKAVPVPLVAVEPASQTEVRARVWVSPGRQPVLRDAGGWKETAIEEVPGRSSLPVLVARTTRPDAPLVLQGTDQSAVDTALVERAVVTVQIADNGTQTYVVRWRLRRLAAGSIDVELPAPVRAVELQVWLGTHQVIPEALDDQGKPSEAGKVARMKLDGALIGAAAVLEFQYQLSPARALASTGDPGPLATLLPAPVVRDCPGPVPCCWQVRVPSAWIVLSPESGPGADRIWSWRGRLPALKLRTPLLDEAGEARDGTEAGPLDVLCWRGAPEPLLLVYVPQQAWLLACSLLCVVFGLILLGARARGETGGRWRPALGVLLLLVLAATAVLWPAMFAAILYGCQPGVMVLAVILLAQWLLHARYRRQVVFLPSFSRKRSGSSLNPPPARPAPGEPSTVDHPRQAGSSSRR
jgi:hypothetical protein